MGGGYGIDAWSLLAAIAERTSRVRLGTMLTPLPWRRPWKVASQAVTLDELSGGRAILAVGLGAVDTGLGKCGEVTDRRIRAELLDEGIEVIANLWAGTPTQRQRWRSSLLGRPPAARGGSMHAGSCPTTAPTGCVRYENASGLGRPPLNRGRL